MAEAGEAGEDGDGEVLLVPPFLLRPPRGLHPSNFFRHTLLDSQTGEEEGAKSGSSSFSEKCSKVG